MAAPRHYSDIWSSGGGRDRPPWRHARIEFDVALTTEQINLGLDQGRFVTAGPQKTGAMLDGVDVLHITSIQGNDEPWNRFRMDRRNKQVYMIGH